MIKPKAIRILKYAVGALLLGYGLLTLAAFLWNAYDTHADIKNGHLVYEKNLGWIDLTHATTTGVTNLIHSIRNSVPNKSSSYQQCMGYFNVKACTVTSFTLNEVPATPSELFQTAAYIYRATSLEFECVQEKIPLLFFDLPLSSGFKDGDLAGNILALYCTIHDVPIDCIMIRLQLVDRNEAISRFWNDGVPKNRTWPLVSSFAYYDELLGRAPRQAWALYTTPPLGLREIQIQAFRISRLRYTPPTQDL